MEDRLERRDFIIKHLIEKSKKTKISLEYLARISKSKDEDKDVIASLLKIGALYFDDLDPKDVEIRYSKAKAGDRNRLGYTTKDAMKAEVFNLDRSYRSHMFQSVFHNSIHTDQEGPIDPLDFSVDFSKITSAILEDSHGVFIRTGVQGFSVLDSANSSESIN